MSFYQRYELARLIADGETKTFRAVENATGRNVLFHFFKPEGQPILAALKSKWGRLPGKPEPPLLELGEFAGSPYAVTEMIEPFTTLRQWVISMENDAPTMEIHLPAAAPTASPAIPAAPPIVPAARAPAENVKAPPPPGAFTQFFDRPPEPPKPASSGPGDFTRWFDAPPSQPVKPASALRPDTRPMLDPQKDEFEKLFEPGPSPSPSAPTDEFEKLFGGNQRPAPPKPASRPSDFKIPLEDTSLPAPPRAAAPRASSKPSWPVSPQSDEETGQFTRLFGSGPSGEAINIEEEQARAAQRAQPEGRPFQPPTEFTRVFGPQDGASLPPPTVPTKVGSASGLFRSVAAAKTEIPAKPAGPGDYTRMTTRAELEAEQAALDKAKAAQAPPPPVAARRGLMIGLAIGGAVLVIALIVTLVVVLRKH